MELHHSIVRGREWSSIDRGVFDTDPAFADTLFNLSENSPCIGLGRPAMDLNGVEYAAPQDDIDGGARPSAVDEYMDIGGRESTYAARPRPVSCNLSCDHFYVNPEQDSLGIAVKMFNPHAENLQVEAYFQSMNNSEDYMTTELYDDGTHQDEQAGDGIYGGILDPITTKAQFSMSLKVQNLSTTDTLTFHDEQQITTIGPVVLANDPCFDFTYDSQIRRQSIKLVLKNEDPEAAAQKINAQLTTSDPRVKEIVRNNQEFGTIAAGAADTCTAFYSFDYIPGYSPDSTVDHPIDFTVTVYSNGYPYWEDSADYVTAVENDNAYLLPLCFHLDQNYPNPFNPSTTIEFTLPKSELVKLKVYIILGKEMSTLVSKKLNQGTHTYTFEGGNLTSGVYYYQLVAGDYRKVKKMILLQ